MSKQMVFDFHKLKVQTITQIYLSMQNDKEVEGEFSIAENIEAADEIASMIFKESGIEYPEA